MPNKKINDLDVKVAVATDLMLVGDPATGTAYKSTLATLPLVPTSRTLTINGVAFDLSANRAWTIGTVTSVGLSMPSAFNVGSSPITSSGTIAVTGAGTTLQYVDGTGALQTFPTILQASDIIAEVRNQSGATMTKGTIVYISGATGNKPLISKALATGDSTSAQTFGLVQTDIANNGTGYIVIIGSISNLDTSALSEGQQLYLSGTTAGTWTTTKPYAPIHLVYVGIVIRSHPTQGTISVKIQNGYELDEIHNVAAQTPSNNDGLFYESSTSLWKNKTIASALGYTPATSARLINTTSPLVGGGDLSADRTLSIPAATTSVNGYLTSTDWNTFNNKQAALTLTTTGTSGAATLVGATLNIPQYSGGGGMAIGGAITSATAGSVLFAGTSGVLQQDNANLFWDDTNNRLGIGTATPTTQLHVRFPDNNTTYHATFFPLNGTLGVGINYDGIKALGGGNTFLKLNGGAGIYGVNLQGNLNLLAQGGLLYAYGSSFCAGYSVNATADLYFNFFGYDAGTTQFRNAVFGNGKGSDIMRLYGSTGNLLLQNGGTFTDAGYRLDVNGTARVNQLYLRALNTAPATASSTGTLGEIRIDASYIYVCTATNTWVRSALTTW